MILNLKNLIIFIVYIFIVLMSSCSTDRIETTQNDENIIEKNVIIEENLNTDSVSQNSNKIKRQYIFLTFWEGMPFKMIDKELKQQQELGTLYSCGSNDFCMKIYFNEEEYYEGVIQPDYDYIQIDQITSRADRLNSIIIIVRPENEHKNTHEIVKSNPIGNFSDSKVNSLINLYKNKYGEYLVSEKSEKGVDLSEYFKGIKSKKTWCYSKIYTWITNDKVIELRTEKINIDQRAKFNDYITNIYITYKSITLYNKEKKESEQNKKNNENKKKDGYKNTLDNI